MNIDVQNTDEITDLVNQYAYGTNSPSSDLAAAWDEINRLGLAGHVAELDPRGFTVIPPEKVAPLDFTQRLRETLLDVAERRTGQRPDVDGATTQGDTPFGAMLTYLLFEDPIFQEAVLNPTALAMATYLVGRSAMLFLCYGFVKGPGGNELPVHTDNVMMPAPILRMPRSAIRRCSSPITLGSTERLTSCRGATGSAGPPNRGEGSINASRSTPLPAPLWYGRAAPGTAASSDRHPGCGWRWPSCTAGCISFLRNPTARTSRRRSSTATHRGSRLRWARTTPWGSRQEGLNWEKVAALPGKSWWD